MIAAGRGRAPLRWGAALFIVCMATWMGMAGCAPKKPGYSAAAEEKLGIEILSLRITAGGYLLDMRYRIRDREKARVFLDPKAELWLLHASTGARLKVPSPPKIGPLRQIPPESELDKIYFVLFANPGRLVKAGDKVGLEVGGVTVKWIPVE